MEEGAAFIAASLGNPNLHRRGPPLPQDIDKVAANAVIQSDTLFRFAVFTSAGRPPSAADATGAAFQGRDSVP